MLSRIADGWFPILACVRQGIGRVVAEGVRVYGGCCELSWGLLPTSRVPPPLGGEAGAGIDVKLPSHGDALITTAAIGKHQHTQQHTATWRNPA